MSPLPSEAFLRQFLTAVINEVGPWCQHDFEQLIAKMDSDPERYMYAVTAMGTAHYWLELLYQESKIGYELFYDSLVDNESEDFHKFLKDFLDRGMFIVHSVDIIDNTFIANYLSNFLNKWFPDQEMDIAGIAVQVKNSVHALEQDFLAREQRFQQILNFILRRGCDRDPNASDRAQGIGLTDNVVEYVGFIIEVNAMFPADLRYLDPKAINKRNAYLNKLLKPSDDPNKYVELRRHEAEKLTKLHDIIADYTRVLKLLKAISVFKYVDYAEGDVLLQLKINNLLDKKSREDAVFWLSSAENFQTIPQKITFLEAVIAKLEWFSQQFSDLHQLLNAEVYKNAHPAFFGIPVLDEIQDDIWAAPLPMDEVESLQVSSSTESTVIIDTQQPYLLIAKGNSSKDSGYLSTHSGYKASSVQNLVGNFFRNLIPKNNNKVDAQPLTGKVMRADENTPLIKKSIPVKQLGRGLPGLSYVRKEALAPANRANYGLDSTVR